MIHFVYYIRNKIENKYYIGITNKIPRKNICDKYNINTSTVDRLKKGIIYKDVIEKYKSLKNASIYSDVYKQTL